MFFQKYQFISHWQCAAFFQQTIGHLHLQKYTANLLQSS